jgi:hypothetical protein
MRRGDMYEAIKDSGGGFRTLDDSMCSMKLGDLMIYLYKYSKDDDVYYHIDSGRYLVMSCPNQWNFHEMFKKMGDIDGY